MSDQIIDNKGQGGDDAAAKAAAEKAKVDAAAAAAAAGAGGGNGGGDGEENVTIKKSELEKIKSDRDNYQRGLLAKKADERNLNPNDKGGNGNTVIDDKKIIDTATVAATKTLRESADKTAKRSFLKTHPEYIDDVQWKELMSHLYFKGGETTHEEVIDRMEAAVIEHKRSTGKLDEYLKSEADRISRENRINSDINSGTGTGGAGDKNGSGKDSGTLTPRGEEMTRRMHNDPEKVKKIDISKDNVIDVTK